MTPARILIAGIGNVFFGDDAFGCEVARRLAERSLPEDVHVVDFGIRGFDLACALTAGYERVILIDAVQRGQPPGTLFLLEPDLPSPEDSPGELPQPHALDPLKVLGFAQMLGDLPKWIRIVGCEPATLGSEDDPAMELSEPVAHAVDEAIAMIAPLLQ